VVGNGLYADVASPTTPPYLRSTYLFSGTGMVATLTASWIRKGTMTRTGSDLIYGTLNVLVLKALTWQPMHGYAISNWLRERSGGTLQVDDAALYKSLHRLESQGAIDSEWGVSENNRRAKFYRLTALGRRQLRDERTAWLEFAVAVTRVLRTA
jgi:PadR family transcriptional regulator PadR